ncbi:MAG: TspO/MBR family protein [Patescibacteria group bacterium]
MNAYDWYSQLIKPSWAPPFWVFGPAWTLLYALITISFGKVFLMAWKKEIAIVVLFFTCGGLGFDCNRV